MPDNLQLIGGHFGSRVILDVLYWCIVSWGTSSKAGGVSQIANTIKASNTYFFLPRTAHNKYTTNNSQIQYKNKSMCQ